MNRRRQRNRNRVDTVISFQDKPAKLQGSFTGARAERRAGMSALNTFNFTYDLMKMENSMNVRDWFKSFRGLDPRSQILDFFNDLALEGVENFESGGGVDARRSKHVSPLLRGFIKSGVFSVWRPTSPDAIRKMITGEGTGKGLDVKGKSAKKGPFSGYVPYLQISENDHKSQVGFLNEVSRVRVFYPNKTSRDMARRILTGGKASVSRASATETDLKKSIRILFKMDPKVYDIDDYASEGIYGIDLPQKLLWEGYVIPRDISRLPGSKYDTGRPSLPPFQEMNNDTLASGGGDWDDDDIPRPVLWHAICGHDDTKCDPMCPQSLLIAYEENGTVTPVVSDFDCFLVGTRGVKYEEPLGEQELSMLSWCIEQIDSILAAPKEGASWTSRWLEVKKKTMLWNSVALCKEMPKFGYADPRSYSMIKGAVHRMNKNGAVRHGPECFNYGFPQDIDDKFLVISDSFEGVPWRYVGQNELISILSDKIDEGFTFPLNPKWVLCDPGWKEVYDKLLSSDKPHVQESVDIWYPPQVRSRIDQICDTHPKGFVECSTVDKSSRRIRATMAAFELKKYMETLEVLRESRAVGLDSALGSSAIEWDYDNPDAFFDCAELDDDI